MPTLHILYAEDVKLLGRVFERTANACIDAIIKENLGEDYTAELTWVKSGNEAMEALSHNPQNYFSIFIMDNNIGEGPTGMDVIAQLHSTFGYDMDKVVIAGISGDLQLGKESCAGDIAKARAIGYTYFIEKGPATSEDIELAFNYIFGNLKVNISSEHKSRVEKVSCEFERVVAAAAPEIDEDSKETHKPADDGELVIPRDRIDELRRESDSLLASEFLKMQSQSLCFNAAGGIKFPSQRLLRRSDSDIVLGIRRSRDLPAYIKKSNSENLRLKPRS